MCLPCPGIGIVFDIDGLDGHIYNFRAWRLIAKYLDPDRLGPCVFVESDMDAVQGRANRFCIGIYDPVDFDYIRRALENAIDPGFAPLHKRFIEKASLDQQPLRLKGYLDTLGLLITEQWHPEDYDICMENGWGYAPKAFPDGLDPSISRLLVPRKRTV